MKSSRANVGRTMLIEQAELKEINFVTNETSSFSTHLEHLLNSSSSKTGFSKASQNKSQSIFVTKTIAHLESGICVCWISLIRAQKAV